MNIWHDISPDCIQPENFTAVIEIPKGGKNKYEMDKATGLLRLNGCCTPPRTIPPTMDLSPAPMRTTATRWMFWFSVRNPSCR